MEDITPEDRLDSCFRNLQEDLANRQEIELVHQFASERLAARMRKRARYKVKGIETRCLQEFEELNQSLENSHLSLSDELIIEARSFILSAFENFNTRQDESNIQVALDETYLFSLWGFGPGASNGVTGSHTVEKISQKMTCTKSCEHMVRRLRTTTPYFVSYDAKQEGIDSSYMGSRLATVPKNEDTVRIIAIEPSGNMALQLAAGRYIENVLKHIGLHIGGVSSNRDTSKQIQAVKNQNLARLGSIDGSLATIDLSKASDMIKPELIQALLPREWYELLMTIRSPYAEINKRQVKLNMISTMGNGFTFPLMTLCITSLIYGMRRLKNGPNRWIDWTRTGVFGDDIIVPTHEYAEFCEILSRACLVVNHDKSYSKGYFRESCGGDFYRGEDVRPFYIKELTHAAHIYVAINQVLEWSAKHFVLSRTLNYLASLIDNPFFVPVWSNPDQGILTTQVSQRYKYLQPKQKYRKVPDTVFLVPLCIGGYVTSDGPDMYYLPRQFKTEWSVRRGRLPKGFLSGHDPRKRSSLVDAKIDMFVDLFLRGSR